MVRPRHSRGFFLKEAKRRARNAVIRNATFAVVVAVAFAWLVAQPRREDGPNPTWTLVGEAIVFALFAWRLVVAVGRLRDPKTHPLLAAFARHGEIDAVVAEVEEAVENGSARVLGDVIATDRFLVHVPWAPDVIAFDDVAWVYVKETRHSVNFIPVGTTRSIELFTFSHHHRWVSFTLTADAEVLELLQARASRGRMGYSPDTERWWKTTRDQLTAADRPRGIER